MIFKAVVLTIGLIKLDSRRRIITIFEHKTDTLLHKNETCILKKLYQIELLWDKRLIESVSP
jgi:hypothetical protein